jgi:hypothetical protein
MTKYSQGIYIPKHPEKYVGKGSIKFRSSWEHAFFFIPRQPPKHNAVG